MSDVFELCSAGVDDLLLVGKTKALGYLPLSTLADRLGPSGPRMIVEHLLRAGVGVLVLDEGECMVGSGAVYAWCPVMLRKHLEANAEAVTQAGWPWFPPNVYHRVADLERFVRAVALVTADPESELYEVIGRAFNDERWR